MAYTTINKSTDYFNTVLYTGNGSLPRAITGVGHQPDFVWLKDRDTAYNHQLYDSVRGTSAGVLYSNSTSAEDSSYQMSSFDSDGFTLGSNLGAVNENTKKIVAWNWKANGSGSANTDGNNPNTVTVSANTTAGFSIIKYQGTDTGGQTIGHGLGVKPKVFITKNISEADNWCVWIDTTGNGTADKRLILNSNNSDYGNYMPTFGTSTITLPSTSDNAWNGNGDNIIGYAFAEKTGYSKFGSYIGNGNDNGTFVYTGFKPQFVMVKASSGADSWQMTDHPRDKDVSPNFARLLANASSTESTNTTWAKIEKFSNGFKMAGTDGVSNQSGRTFIYMAFGQSLVGSNNVPCTAR